MFWNETIGQLLFREKSFGNVQAKLGAVSAGRLHSTCFLRLLSELKNAIRSRNQLLNLIFWNWNYYHLGNNNVVLEQLDGLCQSQKLLPQCFHLIVGWNFIDIHVSWLRESRTNLHFYLLGDGFAVGVPVYRRMSLRCRSGIRDGCVARVVAFLGIHFLRAGIRIWRFRSGIRMRCWLFGGRFAWRGPGMSLSCRCWCRDGRVTFLGKYLSSISDRNSWFRSGMRMRWWLLGGRFATSISLSYGNSGLLWFVEIALVLVAPIATALVVGVEADVYFHFLGNAYALVVAPGRVNASVELFFRSRAPESDGGPYTWALGVILDVFAVNDAVVLHSSKLDYAVLSNSSSTS